MLDERTLHPGLRARVLFFRSLPELAQVSHESLATLAEASRLRRFAEGAKLLVEGRPATHVYMLLEGRAECARHGETWSIGAPAVAGLVPVIAADPEGLEVTAMTQLAALQIPASTVRRLMHHDFSLVRSVLKLLSQRVLEVRGPAPIPARDTPPTLGRWRDRELTMTERLLQLVETPWGRSANVDALAEIALSIRERRLDAGARLWTIGDPAEQWFRVDYGRIRCSDEAGRAVFAGAGDVLGMIEAYAESPRAFAAEAETPVIALEVALSDMLSILEAHVPLAAQMTSLLARRLL
jgi:CRP-like cAMP-binding protein